MGTSADGDCWLTLCAMIIKIIAHCTVFFNDDDGIYAEAFAFNNEIAWPDICCEGKAKQLCIKTAVLVQRTKALPMDKDIGARRLRKRFPIFSLTFFVSYL